MNILVDNIPTYYRDEGKGKVLLFLHGWGSDLSTFNNLATWAKDKYRVLRLDLPGFGKTANNRPDGWSLGDYIVFINEFMDKLGVKQVEVLVGHSMGGRIAIKGVAEGKLHTNKLVLLSSHGLVDHSLRNTFWKVVAKTGKAVTLVLPGRLRNRLKQGLYRGLGVQDYVSADPVQKKTFKKLISEDLKQTAEKINVPTLIIYGSEDKETPSRFGEVFNKAIKGSKLWVIRGAGHYIHDDAFSKVVKHFKDFMEKNK